jgi:putative transposase
VLPGVKEQLCRKHKVANVLDKLPKRLHGAAKGHLHEIMYAPDRDAADAKLTSFKAVCDAKYPWAVASLVDHADQLLTFLDFPAEHWVHVRTTNPIESTFGTVKARTKKPRCAGSHAAGLAAALKLMEAAEQRWRRLNAPPLVAAVLHGVHSKDGQRVATAPLSQTTARDPA